MPRKYHGAPYWETETPLEACAGSVLLRWYPAARKLQVHRTFEDGRGATKTAAVVTVDMEGLALAPDAIDLLQQVLVDAKDLAGAVQTTA